MDQRDVVMPPEQGDDLLRLARAQQAVVDEDAGQPVADRLVDQHRRHGGIDPARQAADRAGAAHPVAHARDLARPERRHGPVPGAAGDAPREGGKQRRAVVRVRHFGVEHDAVIAARIVGEDGVRRALAAPDGAEAGRRFGHPVAMAHPHAPPRAGRPGGRRRRTGGNHRSARPRRGRTRGPRRFRRGRRGGRTSPAGRSRCRAPAGRDLEHPVRRARRLGLQRRGRPAPTARSRAPRTPPAAPDRRSTARSRNTPPPRAPAARSAASPGCRNRGSGYDRPWRGVRGRGAAAGGGGLYARARARGKAVAGRARIGHIWDIADFREGGRAVRIREKYRKVIRDLLEEYRSRVVENPGYKIDSRSSFGTCLGYTKKYIYTGRAHYRYDAYHKSVAQLTSCFRPRGSDKRIIHLDIGSGPGLFSWVVYDYFTHDQQYKTNFIDLYCYDAAPSMKRLAKKIWEKFRAPKSLDYRLNDREDRK